MLNEYYQISIYLILMSCFLKFKQDYKVNYIVKKNQFRMLLSYFHKILFKKMGGESRSYDTVDIFFN